MKLHHIGYLVKNIEKSLPAFLSLGYNPVSLCTGEESCTAYVYDEVRQCNFCFLRRCDDAERNTEQVYVELIAPCSPSSPVWGLLSTYKNAPYHLCFESEDLERDILSLRKSGWLVFQPAAAAPAINNRLVVFLVHRSAGIVELVSNG